jgi:lipoprotein-anchoring transpeptidase ErfK/SrfK
MPGSKRKLLLNLFILVFSGSVYADPVEIDASAFGTQGAPIAEHIKSSNEKIIIVHPADNVWGAYNGSGKLVRWGIATAGNHDCRDAKSCKTATGSFRIYSLGNESCVSKKYPEPNGGASMPYCMFFKSGQAIHGSSDIQFNNVSHGCVRVHEADAKWLRYHFVEGPTANNNYRGTLVLIQDY